MSRTGRTPTARCSRRSLLRGLGSAAVLAAGSGVASNAVGAQSGQDVTVLDLRESADHELPAVEELLVFAHGWLGASGAPDQAADLASSLAAGGYEPDETVAVQWDASSLNYPSAEAHTADVGAELAGLVEAYHDEVGGSIRLVGHSLGGRVVLHTLDALSEGYEVATVAPVGAAADGSTVTEGGIWYDGIASNAAAVRNYHSENDSTVGSAYGGAGDTALGTEGAPDAAATPENYTDVDVTEHVASHTDYTDNAAVGEDLAAAIEAQRGGEETPCDDYGAEGATIEGEHVCDLDGDGRFRDVTGDGEVGQDDVVYFFENQHRDAWKRPDLFDFSGSDSVGHGDVIALFEHVSL